MKREKKIQKKRIHDNIKDIEERISKGEKTTFAERNWLNMQKKSAKKQCNEKSQLF